MTIAWVSNCYQMWFKLTEGNCIKIDKSESELILKAGCS